MAIIEDVVESLNEKSLQARILILVGIILVLIGLFYYFFYSENQEQIVRLQSTLQKRQKLMNEYENIAKQLPKFEAENKKLEHEFQQASKKLPVKKEIPTIIDSVYSAVNASGLVPIAFTPQKEVSREVYVEIPIALNVNGSYFELANFFDRIAKLPRIMNIRNLNLKVKQDTRKKMILNATFQAVTFRVKQVN